MGGDAGLALMYGCCDGGAAMGALEDVDTSVALGIPNPLEWIQGKLQEFLALPRKFDELDAVARAIADHGRTAAGRAEAADVVQEVGRLRALWREVRSKIGIRTETQSMGALVAVPALAWVVGGLLGAGMVIAGIVELFGGEDQESTRVLDMVEAGEITPDEAQRIIRAIRSGGPLAGFFSQLGQAGKLLALGAVAVLAWPEIRKAARR